ncbi:MAG: PAS domain-containing protein, partial [Chthoniobacterales bacterium]
MKSGFLDKLIERLDKLDAGSLQTQFLRLAGEKGLLETIFHAIQEGLIVLDGQGRITYANRAAESMLGFDLTNAAGTKVSRFIPDIEWSHILKLDEQEW